MIDPWGTPDVTGSQLRFLLQRYTMMSVRNIAVEPFQKRTSYSRMFACFQIIGTQPTDKD
jgi:hypothetical protein